GEISEHRGLEALSCSRQGVRANGEVDKAKFTAGVRGCGETLICIGVCRNDLCISDNAVGLIDDESGNVSGGRLRESCGREQNQTCYHEQERHNSAEATTFWP